MQSARAGRLREGARLGVAANTAGVEAARWQTKVAGFVKDEAMLRVKLDRADRSEREASERRRAREEQVSARRAASERAAFRDRLDAAEGLAAYAAMAHRAPKRELCES